MKISSIRELGKITDKIKKILSPGDVVFLYGEIGVGKTTFAKHLINQFQINNKIQTTEVLSPTFNLLNEYELKDLVVKHYDLFRLKDKSEIKNLDLFDNNPKIITLIEWPQLIDKENVIKSINLVFKYENELNDRSVKIEGLD